MDDEADHAHPQRPARRETRTGLDSARPGERSTPILIHADTYVSTGRKSAGPTRITPRMTKEPPNSTTRLA